MLLRDLLQENKWLTYLRRVRLRAGVSLLSLSMGWTTVAHANITGSDTQNFNPTFSGHDFVTVYASQTLGAGNYSLGLFANYAVNTLPYFLQKNRHNDTTKEYNDAVTGVDLTFGYGLFDNFDLGIMAPYVVHQHVTDKDDYHGQFAETGNTEVRIGAKLRLWHNDSTGVALVGSVNINRMQDNPYVGDGSGISYNGEMIVDHKFTESFMVGANAGYRFRSAGEPLKDPVGNTPINPVENQVIASAAAKYRFASTGTSLVGEVYGSSPAEDISDISPREANTYESVFGLKQEVAKDWIIHFGVGGEIQHSLSSPDFRVYAGVNWMPVKEPKKVVKKEKPLPPLPPPPPPPKVVEKVKVVRKVVVVKQPKVRQPDQQIVIRDVLFKFNSAEISQAAAYKSLNDLGKLVTGPKGLDKLIIEGHTCSIGSDQYNYELSVKRANAIKNFMVQAYGIDPNKIIAVGFGESRPIAPNTTDSGRRLNRRVEFKVYHASKSGLAQK